MHINYRSETKDWWFLRAEARPRGQDASLFTKLRTTRGSEVGRVHYYTRIRGVIYGYVRHLFGAQVVKEVVGKGLRSRDGVREKRFMSAPR